jgi:hypothetical protein
VAFQKIPLQLISRKCLHRCWQGNLQKPATLQIKNCQHKLFSAPSSWSSTSEGSGLIAREDLLGDNATNSNTDVDGSPLGIAQSTTKSQNPTCRIVATSDGEISRPTAVVSLSRSSKSLLDKIELLYVVESLKRLGNLEYMAPQSADEVSFETVHHTNNEGMDGMRDEVGKEDEELVSILKQALNDGGYKLMTRRDLDLCSALNAGYLLRLSLLPDIKELDSCIGREFYPEMDEQSGETIPRTNTLLFDGRVLVFRRGYSKEITTGRLLLPKLDYLQASLVQRSSSALTRKLGEFEQRIEGLFLDFMSVLNNSVQRACKQILRQFRKFGVEVLRNFGLHTNDFIGDLTPVHEQNETTTTDTKPAATTSSMGVRGNKVFKFTRYQASSTMTSNSFDLNDALSPFLLYDHTTTGTIFCQYDDKFPSETNESLESRPPLESFRLLERISIQNTVDFFSMRGRRELIKNYFKSSTLVEPAFEEVIVISRPMRKMKPKTIDIYPPDWLYEAAKVFDVDDRLPNPKNKTQDNAPDIPIPPIDIKVFSDVPMANIEAVLPKAKLIFRPADAVVFDLVSVVSFLAVAGSLRFDSPKLDLIALISLIVFVVQTFFRYSNKYARYDLIVNKFITSKVLHRGPGRKEILNVILFGMQLSS